jgi:hypothetical protein
MKSISRSERRFTLLSGLKRVVSLLGCFCLRLSTSRNVPCGLIDAVNAIGNCESSIDKFIPRRLRKLPYKIPIHNMNECSSYSINVYQYLPSNPFNDQCYCFSIISGVNIFNKFVHLLNVSYISIKPHLICVGTLKDSASMNYFLITAKSADFKIKFQQNL